MRRIRQTRFGSRGNCLAACIASIADGDLDLIDFSCADFRPGGWVEAASWAAAALGRRYAVGRPPVGQLYIAHGPSHRGREHATVYRDGELVHDPHPDGRGLLHVVYTSYLVE